LLPKLVKDYKQLLPNGFTFQHDGALAYVAGITQDWLKSNCSDFITNDEWSSLRMSGPQFT